MYNVQRNNIRCDFVKCHILYEFLVVLDCNNCIIPVPNQNLSDRHKNEIIYK